MRLLDAPSPYPTIQPEYCSGVGCFAHKTFMFIKFLVDAWSQCGGFNKEHFLFVHWESNSLRHLDHSMPK